MQMYKQKKIKTIYVSKTCHSYIYYDVKLLASSWHTFHVRFSRPTFLLSPEFSKVKYILPHVSNMLKTFRHYCEIRLQNKTKYKRYTKTQQSRWCSQNFSKMGPFENCMRDMRHKSWFLAGSIICAVLV